jgi:hypothetical protein
MHKLVPNIIILRLRPGTGLQLRSAALLASTSVEDAACAPEARARLGACAESGAFGPAELSGLQAYLEATAGGHSFPSVKAMVAAASLEGLSAEEAAARHSEESAAAARRAALRASLQKAAEEEVYAGMLGKARGGARGPGVAGGGSTLRDFAPQAALGGGLLLALASAALLGYSIGRNMFGEKSGGAWVTCLAFAIGTLVLEATLIVLRLGRADSLESSRKGEREGRGAPSAAPAAAPAPVQGAVLMKDKGAGNAPGEAELRRRTVSSRG